MLIASTIGIGLLICIGAYLLSIGAELLSQRLGKVFVGSIVLALITTLPEYLFVAIAASKGQYKMAVGSAIGSCSLLVTLGTGLVIIISTTKLSRAPVKIIELSKETRWDAIYLLLTALIALFLVWQGNDLNLIDAIILTAVFFSYAVLVSKGAIELAASKAGAASSENVVNLWLSFMLLLPGALIVVLCSEPFVDKMIELARVYKVSPALIAIVIGPWASEMPEKLTAYITVYRKAKLAEISICNFIGSKINHNSLLLSVMIFIAAFKGASGGAVPDILSLSFIVMTVLILLVALSIARRKLTLWEGILFTLAYSLPLAAAWHSFHKPV